MGFIYWSAISAVGLFLGMLLCAELGRRIGLARLAQDPDGFAKGSGPVEAAALGLLGLLLAFTFSGAASRFEARRELIVAEANAIGTAYLRVDLLPSDAQPEVRELFRRYLDARVDAYRHTANVLVMEVRLSEADRWQGQLWAKAVAASARSEMPAQTAMLLLPALNEMIDISTTRAAAMRNHPPLAIFFLLAGLSLVSSLLVGYGMCGARERNWFYVLLVTTTISLTFYLILDMEYPRFGLLRVDAADQALIELRGHLR
ncbi:MAG: hypothetical protein JNN30_02190 [Rhodanobacteraceae bacterium]|nr:hypothetical protein [Rhodanobacteraceae bacterium]